MVFEGQKEDKMRSLAERFWEKVDVRGEDECWEWRAARDRQGYGLIGLPHSGKLVYAHRLSWELENGPIPPGFCICHVCDWPSCVNVKHLFLGSRTDNMQDAAKKGRIELQEEEIAGLVERMHAGDLEARNRLVNSQVQHVFCIAGNVGGPHRYDDYFQEGCRKLLEALPKFQLPEKAPYLPHFLAFVSKVVGNELTDLLRQEQRDRAHYAPFPKRESDPWYGPGEDNDLSMEELVADERDRGALAELITQETMEQLADVLSPRQWEVARLVWDGYTQEEIAEEMGVSQQAISGMLHRIREKIRKMEEFDEWGL